jgi:hypothetical protein
MRGLLSLAVGVVALFPLTLAYSQLEKIYGVNLGSW